MEEIKVNHVMLFFKDDGVTVSTVTASLTVPGLGIVQIEEATPLELVEQVRRSVIGTLKTKLGRPL